MDERTFAREFVVPGIVPEVTHGINKRRTAKAIGLGISVVAIVGTLTYILR